MFYQSNKPSGSMSQTPTHDALHTPLKAREQSGCPLVCRCRIEVFLLAEIIDRASCTPGIARHHAALLRPSIPGHQLHIASS